MQSLQVLVLRHLPGGATTVNDVLAAHQLGALPTPGTCLGNDPWQVWTGPTHTLLLTTHGSVADGVLAALLPGRNSLAFALDQSAGWRVFELLGAGVNGVLPRLLDASAIPAHAGQGSRGRFIDIGAVVMRVAPDRVLLAVERPHETYAAQWFGHAGQAAAASP